MTPLVLVLKRAREAERLFDWQIEFFGHDLDLDACEAIMFSRFPTKEVREEGSLFNSKWWDYRHLHPVKATYLFAHIFTEEVRAIIRKHLDNTPPKTLPSGKVKDWHPLQKDIFDPPAHKDSLRGWKIRMNGTIRARHIADKYGIPYRFFIRKGLEHYYFGRMYLFEERQDGGKPRKLPTPEMLTTPECLSAIAEAWMDEFSSRIYHGTHPRYLISEDQGHRDTIDHQKFICDQIAGKADPIPALAKFLGKRLLSQEFATTRFGEERVKRALGVANIS